jgi:hypothetical protein
MGLRPSRGSFQLATKISADGTIRMRIALETGTRFGTSGTYPWLPIRFALQTASDGLCITDEPLLARSYRGSRHNCTDVLDLTLTDRRYEIRAPDTRAAPPARTTSTLSIFDGSTLIQGPTVLTPATCTTQLPALPCTSGGPCS